jgi:hypothetical protein
MNIGEQYLMVAPQGAINNFANEVRVDESGNSSSLAFYRQVSSTLTTLINFELVQVLTRV